MSVKFSKTLSFIAPALLGALLTGCFVERTVTSDEKTLKVSKASSDPRVRFLVATTGTAPELISVTYDSVARDTGYIMEPPITPEQKRRGMRGTGVGFKAKEIDRLIAARAKDSIAALKDDETGSSSAGGGLLSKRAQTRWDHWSSPYDVKLLTEVRFIYVYIHTSGPARLGPNWTAAVRSAIANWNAQAKGTAISFIETTSPDFYDITFRGSFGIGSDGSLTSSAFLTANQYVTPEISLWVNTGYEHSGVPHNQKTTVAMSLLALSTNITFTGMEGYYWNNGASIHIPGTPATDGDGLTPGSSILTYGTSSVSTPVMTAGDLKAFRTMYPTFGFVSITPSHQLLVNSKRGFLIQDLVSSAQVASDTLFFMRRDGKLMRRIGEGNPVQIWPGAGSSGTARTFLYSKGYLAVVNTAGKLFSKTPTGNWINQSPSWTFGINDFRLDGSRLIAMNTARTHLFSYILGGTTASPHIMDWYSANAGITDYKIRNGLLVVVDNGSVHAMQDYTFWTKIHDAADGPATHVQMSDQLMTMFYTPAGYPYKSFAVRHGGINGWWAMYYDPVDSHKDIDLCGDKVAFIQESTYLRIIDFTNWIVYEHFTMPTAPNIRHVKLSGPNCDFITASRWANYRMGMAKYGIDFDNQYSDYADDVDEIVQGLTTPYYRP